MFTKIRPAGDLFAYLKGKRTSMGDLRQQAPIVIQGNETAAIELLVAQAAPGVRPRNHQPAGTSERKVKRRPQTEWVRHCQSHLVHFMNCFHESQKRVEDHLVQIVHATEDLVLAGLPREALHFAWYKHGQEYGTHSHAGMVRMVLHSGAPYEPRLSTDLCRLFDRLVSRQLGYSDPLDSRGFRVVHAAWGSWKSYNYDKIREVCQLATTEWRGKKLKSHEDFIELLRRPALGLTIAVRPNKKGDPIVQPGIPSLRIPLYRNTVVVLVNATRRLICFKGPACRPDFSLRRWRERLKKRAAQARALRWNPKPVYEAFKKSLEDRIHSQQSLLNGPDEHRVLLKDFEWLAPAEIPELRPRDPAGLVPEEESPRRRPRALGAPFPERFSLFSSQVDWGEFHYPFVSDAEPQLADITDPVFEPLREWIIQDLERMDAEDSPEDEAQTTEGQGPTVDECAPSPEFPVPDPAGSGDPVEPADGRSILHSANSKAEEPDAKPAPEAKPISTYYVRHNGLWRPTRISEKRRRKMKSEIALRIGQHWEETRNLLPRLDRTRNSQGSEF